MTNFEKLTQTIQNLDQDLISNCKFFTTELLEWNKIHNLSGAREESDVYDLIIDSLYPLSFLDPFNNALDIGTGAGFPGLILAIAKRDVRFTLVEPISKRVSFLNYIKSSLSLNNVEIKRERVENIPAKSYDLITSKAVSSCEILLDLSKPFITKSTTLLLYKGKNTQKESLTIPNSRVIRENNSSYIIIKG